MKYLPPIAIATAALVVSFSISSCTSSQNLSGKYQSDEANAGIEFLDGSKAMLVGDGGTSVNATYEIVEEGKKLKLTLENGDKPEEVTLEMKREGDKIILTQPNGKAATFSPVKEFSLKSASSSGTATQARNVEAKTYVGSMNRGQQAYFLEKNEFSTTLDDLGLGIRPETKGHRYQIVSGKDNVVMNVAMAKDTGLKSYIGLVFAVKADGTEERTTLAQLCETEQDLSTPPEPPSAPSSLRDNVACPDGSTPIK